jgi:hypothetical protein
MRFATALLLLGSLVACRAAPLRTAPRADRARASSPAELLPDDLDFVVRIDALRIRQNPVLADIVRDLAKTQPSELLASTQAAFAEASAVWVGTRWMSDGFHGDGVVAIEGVPGNETTALATSRPRRARRMAISVTEADVFERPAVARGEAALEIVMGNRGVVLATAAEADAVLRVLDSGSDEGRLEPPARGLVSFAGRPRSGSPLVAATTSGTLREITEGLVGYAGSLEESRGVDSDGPGAIALEASLAYASANDAVRAAERAKQAIAHLVLAGGTMRTMVDSIKLTEVGSSVQVRATVPFASLATLH